MEISQTMCNKIYIMNYSICPANYNNDKDLMNTKEVWNIVCNILKFYSTNTVSAQQRHKVNENLSQNETEDTIW